MPQRENASHVIVTDSIVPGNYAAPVDGDGVEVDSGDATTVIVSFGAAVEAGTTIHIQDSDDDITYADLTPVQIPGIDSFLLGPDFADPNANETLRWAYVGGKKYLRVTLEDTVTNTDAHAQIIIDRLFRGPNLVGYTA